MGKKLRVMIYGVTEAGMSLFNEICGDPNSLYRVVAFLDDRGERGALRIHGVPVLGGQVEIEPLVRKHRVEMIVIATPSATDSDRTRILAGCAAAGVQCNILPGVGELIEDQSLAAQIRELHIEDLLGRSATPLEDGKLGARLDGRMVLVTGAAGSIGSELCRQIARFHPAGIIGFEIAESPLFEIDYEMRRLFPRVPFHAEIGNIQNRARVDEVLSHYRPSAIYHAAAYKHVPLMETHVFEAIANNVLGTYNLAEAAAMHGVEDFVMISSDKAVRPTSVMGATKRIAERLMLGVENSPTQFVAVRFGNVLGSSGSVIPLFKQQIAAGGPVTVTHAEMRRFFMTIPEACQLVLQASVIGKNGQICVLEMGQAIKIVDLARSLILLAGLKPDEDIKIEFTGVRPGEKLCEEWSTLLEGTDPTEHGKIRTLAGGGLPKSEVQAWITALREMCASRDIARLVVALKEIVSDYHPSAPLLERVIDGGKDAKIVAAPGVQETRSSAKEPTLA